MLGVHDYPLFVSTCLLLNLTPGPDTMYILGRSLYEGRRSGIASVLGISTGCLVHTAFAAFGLSAILMASATAFTLVKWLGALYLIYLGINLLRSSHPIPALAKAPPAIDVMSIYRQGVITNVLNPKVALFFLALLPQFVTPGGAHPTGALLILGLTFVATGTLYCLGLAFFASTLHRSIVRRPRISIWIGRFTGLTFLGLGVKLALSEKP